MRIEDLDEFEGLTADMVRVWLRAKGCVFDGTWARPYRPTPYYWDGQLLCPSTLGHIAYDFGYPSLQSLLREINPRMRPGWPTEGEIEAHGLDEGWLMRDDEGVLRTGYFRRNAAGICFVYATEDGERWTLPVDGQVLAFWPCDAHGNKVRRGTVPA